MICVAWPARVRLLVGWALGLGACSTPAGGPTFLTFGVDTEPATQMLGGAPEEPPQKPMELCVRVPVLLGSAVEKSERVNGLAVRIAATRSVTHVTFPGADDADAARSYELSDVRYGIQEAVSVSANGVAFDVVIASQCTNP
jgi:hypothetical protein